MSEPSVLLYFDDELTLAQALGREANLPLACIERHVFPDGEIKLRLPVPLPCKVVLLRSLHQPNTKLVEVLLAARTARELGAQHLTLVTPYLAYMRQDIAFQPGEAVSQKIVGRFLAELFDAVITVDPHLHRISTLREAIPCPQALTLPAAPLLADFVHSQCKGALLIGPDEESEQWISAAARQHGFDLGVCRKTRHGDTHVEVELPDVPVHGRHVVLLDDIASSGHTLAQATRLLLQAGAKTVDVAITHALFSGDAVQVVHNAGVRHIWSTDTVAHESSCVSIAPLLALALSELDTAD